MTKFFYYSSLVMGVTCAGTGILVMPFNDSSIICIVVGAFIIVTARKN